MYRGARIAVVIPAHNEARLLPVTLSTLPSFVDHVVVVDDASQDETAQVARDFITQPIDLITLSVNQGVGGAIRTGYRRALDLGADIAVVVGADAQMAPEEMSSLCDPIIEGEADYVKGDRLGHPDVRNLMPRMRFWGNWALTFMTRAACGAWHLRDSQCGYTAISKKALSALPLESLYPRYGFPNDLIGRLMEQGARIADRPVTPIYGEEQSEIRICKVVFTISGLLARIWVRRLWHRLHRSPARMELNPR